MGPEVQLVGQEMTTVPKVPLIWVNVKNFDA